MILDMHGEEHGDIEDETDEQIEQLKDFLIKNNGVQQEKADSRCNCYDFRF